MKRLFVILSLILVGSMLLSACGAPAAEPETPVEPEAPVVDEPESTEKTVLNVWSFTNEILTMAVAFEKTQPW